MRSFCLPLILLCAAGGVAAQSAPVGAASASQATAPTGPVARAIETARTDGDARPGPAPVPQLAVPLSRKVPPNPVAMKPGRTAPVRGGVDDRAARCRANGDGSAACARRSAASAP